MDGCVSSPFACKDDIRNIFIEAPSAIPDVRKHASIKKFLSGRNSYWLNAGIISPNTIIGRYCSLSHSVNIGVSNHNTQWLSTGVFDINMVNTASDDGIYTVLESDVWVGVNVTILKELPLATEPV